MADTTNISWSDCTFNPWIGCSRVSDACQRCYAAAWAKRSGLVEWDNHPRKRTAESTWKRQAKQLAALFRSQKGTTA